MNTILQTVPQWQPTEADCARENEMAALLEYFSTPGISKEEQSTAWLKYQGLHQRRGPEFVRHLEQKMGLIHDVRLTPR